MPWTRLTPSESRSGEVSMSGRSCSLAPYMWFAWLGMVVFNQWVVDVVCHQETACACCVVPCDVNTCKFGPRPVGDDRIMLLKRGEEVFCMAFAEVFDAKVINDEDKGDWAPLVSPEAWCEVALIVNVKLEPFKEKVVGKFARLFETVDSFIDLEVYPSVVCILCEIVLVDDFLGDVAEFDSDIF